MNLKKGKSWGAAVVLAIVLLSSCRSLKNTNTLFQSEYDKFADTAKGIYIANEDFKRSTNSVIRPFDLIAIRNLQNPEGLNTGSSAAMQNAQVFRVDRDGSILLPVIGLVNLNELNQADAASKIQTLYGKSLLKDPIIELTIVNYKVTILGEASRPGNYQLDRENTDLIDLIGISGGLTPAADAKKIKIIRGDRKKPEIIYVNLKNIESLSNNKLELQKGDIVYIPSRGLYNTTQNINSYSGLLQPAFLVLNALILVYTIGR